MLNGKAGATKGAAAYHKLKGMIVDGEFMPLQHLLARDLSNRIGYGPTPIREALLRLQAEGFVVTTHNKGFQAKLLSVKEFSDLYDLALLLMRHIIQTSDFSIMARHLQIILYNSASISQSGSNSHFEYACLLEELYYTLSQFSKNDACIEMLDRFTNLTHLIRLVDLESSGNFEEIRSDMNDLLAALREVSLDTVADNLSLQFFKKKRRIPSLVREIIARSHGTYMDVQVCHTLDTAARKPSKVPGLSHMTSEGRLPAKPWLAFKRGDQR